MQRQHNEDDAWVLVGSSWIHDINNLKDINEKDTSFVAKIVKACH